MDAQPIVSVIVPAYGRAGLLAQAIDSCSVAAGGLPIEVIVVDDGSPESLQTIAERHGARYFRQGNAGSSAARNTGLGMARGEWVKFLDSDDVLQPGALLREVRAGRESGCGLVASGWIVTELRADGSETEDARHDAPPFELELADDLLAGRAVPTGAALYQADVARATAWDGTLAKLNDWDYFVRAALQAGRLRSVSEPAYRWRQHAGERITSSTSFLGHAREFYSILDKLATALQERGELTPPRRLRLAQYFYKELRGLYRFDPASGRRRLARILELDPAFQPRDEEHSRAIRAACRALPLAWVLETYGLVRSRLDGRDTLR